MPLRRAADGSAFRPGIVWPETKGPVLKPDCVGLGFRGMNAPAPSDGTNNGKGIHLFCRGFVEESRCAGLGRNGSRLKSAATPRFRLRAVPIEFQAGCAAYSLRNCTRGLIPRRGRASM